MSAFGKSVGLSVCFAFAIGFVVLPSGVVRSVFGNSTQEQCPCACIGTTCFVVRICTKDGKYYRNFTRFKKYEYTQGVGAYNSETTDNGIESYPPHKNRFKTSDNTVQGVGGSTLGNQCAEWYYMFCNSETGPAESRVFPASDCFANMNIPWSDEFDRERCCVATKENAATCRPAKCDDKQKVEPPPGGGEH
jgi:hypothetical protein